MLGRLDLLGAVWVAMAHRQSSLSRWRLEHVVVDGVQQQLGHDNEPDREGRERKIGAGDPGTNAGPSRCS
jgi:hypothetical protein